MNRNSQPFLLSSSINIPTLTLPYVPQETTPNIKGTIGIKIFIYTKRPCHFNSTQKKNSSLTLLTFLLLCSTQLPTSLLKSVTYLQHRADLFDTPHEQGEDTQNKQVSPFIQELWREHWQYEEVMPLEGDVDQVETHSGKPYSPPHKQGILPSLFLRIPRDDVHEVAEIGEESSSESLRRNESSMNERAIAGDAHKASTDVYGGQAITVTLIEEMSKRKPVDC